MKTGIFPMLVVACFVLGCGGDQDSSRDSRRAGDGVRESVAQPGHEPTTKIIVTRDAKDLGPGLGGPDRIATGKGAINCGSQRIFVWSMEMRVGDTRSEREAASWLCTDPPGWRPGAAVVACA